MSTRQYLFISFLVKGKSAKQAAALAGFSPCVAALNIEAMLSSAYFQTELAAHMADITNRRSQLEQAAKVCSQAMHNESLSLIDRTKIAASLAKITAQIARMPTDVAKHVFSNNIANYMPEPEEILPTPEQLETQQQLDTDKEIVRTQKQLEKAKAKALAQAEAPIHPKVSAATPSTVCSEKDSVKNSKEDEQAPPIHSDSIGLPIPQEQKVGQTMPSWLGWPKLKV